LSADERVRAGQQMTNSVMETELNQFLQHLPVKK
jgi:hypothetical protein